MAGELFRLFGEISVDVKNFNDAIDSAIAKVNSLAAELDNINGKTINVTINQTTTGSGVGTGGVVGAAGATGTVSGAGTGVGYAGTTGMGYGTKYTGIPVATGSAIVPFTYGTIPYSSSNTSGYNYNENAYNGYLTAPATEDPFAAPGAGSGEGLGLWGLVNTASSFMNSEAFKRTASVFATMGINAISDDFMRFYNVGEEYYTALQTNRARFGAMLGMTEEEANKFADEITTWAVEESPLSINDAYRMASYLLAYDVPPEELISNMNMYSDLALGDSNLALRIARAHAQVKGKNTLQAQELNQMTEAYVPLIQALVDYYNSPEYAALIESGEYEYRSDNRGITTSEFRGGLNNIYDDRPIYVEDEDVTAALMMLTSEGGKYYGATKAVMKTHGGQSSRLDELKQLEAAEFFTAFGEFETSTLFPHLADNAQYRTELFDKSHDEISRYAEVIGEWKMRADDKWTSFVEMLARSEEQNPGWTAGMTALTTAGLSKWLLSSRSSGLWGAVTKGAGGTMGAISVISGLLWAGIRKNYRDEDLQFGLDTDMPTLGTAFMSDRTKAILRENGGKYDPKALGFWGQNEYSIGRMLQFFADVISMPYGDLNYLVHPLADLYKGFGNVPENASTFLSDWGDLFYHHLGGKFLFGEWEGADAFWRNDDPSTVEDLQRERQNIKQGGGPRDFDTLYFDDGQHLLNMDGYSSLLTQLDGMPAQITAAVQEGFSGATVTVNVTTGDVRLNDGTLVGSLATRVDAVLGALNSRAARG